jgi:SagB-type dehydrogenase family enzyme
MVILVALNGCNSKTSLNNENNTVKAQVSEAAFTYLLPAPNTDGTMSVEQALNNRRSYRNFTNKALSQEQLSQILWAAYGVTKPRETPEFLRGGLRTAPSAGALYPFEIYVIVGNVIGIETGVYKYDSKNNTIVKTIDQDVREELCKASWNQSMVKDAPISVFYSAIYSRMTNKYGDRGRERYVCMDLGHSAQNVYLQAEALNLGTCAIGAFEDKKVSIILQLPEEEEPLYIMPVGYY